MIRCFIPTTSCTCVSSMFRSSLGLYRIFRRKLLKLTPDTDERILSCESFINSFDYMEKYEWENVYSLRIKIDMYSLLQIL